MKKSIVILLIGLTVVLSSCTNSVPFDPEKSTGSDALQNPKYVIYWNATADDVNLKLLVDDVKLEEAKQKTFSFSKKTNIEKQDNVENTRTLDIGDECYELDYRKSYKTDLYSSTKFQSYSEFDTFETSDVQVDYRRADGAVVFLSDTNTDRRLVSGELSEDEAKGLAMNTLVSLYGDDVLDEYVFTNVIFTNDSLKKCYTVVYTRLVHDVQTNDSIQLSFNMQGNLISINAKLLGIYSTASTDLSEQQLTSARTVLVNALGEGWTIHNETLIVDSLGDYYLRVEAVDNTQEETTALELFINIK